MNRAKSLYSSAKTSNAAYLCSTKTTPRYNIEYFKRLVKNISHIKNILTSRQIEDPIFKEVYRDDFIDGCQKIQKLKRDLSKSISKAEDGTCVNEIEIENLSKEIKILEDKLFPIVSLLPNRVSPNTTEKNIIIEDLKPSAIDPTLVKYLNNIKLCYINNCYSKSVVGPNSHYYTGIGFKLQNAMQEYFLTNFLKKDYELFSGLSLIKSNCIFAANSCDQKNYANDACRILSSSPEISGIHLSETSRETLFAYSSLLQLGSTNEPKRLVAAGSSYRLGIDEFDSDNTKVAQYETVKTLSLCPSLSRISSKEFADTSEYIWSIYKDLNLPTRFVQCSNKELYDSEYEARRIDIWLPTRKRWFQVSRTALHTDYFTIRAGMKRGHVVDTTVYDGEILFAGIVENNQTSRGKFICPNILGEHFIGLSRQEQEEYLPYDKSEPVVLMSGYTEPISKLINVIQKRNLTKKGPSDPILGHSLRVKKNAGQEIYAKRVIVFSLFWFVYFNYDLEYLWHSYVPRFIRKFCYEKVHRYLTWPVYNWVIYPKDTRPKVFPTFEEHLQAWDNSINEQIEAFDVETQMVKHLPGLKKPSS